MYINLPRWRESPLLFSQKKKNVIYINSIAPYQKNEAKQRLWPAEFLAQHPIYRLRYANGDNPRQFHYADLSSYITVRKNDLTVQVFQDVKGHGLIYGLPIHFFMVYTGMGNVKQKGRGQLTLYKHWRTGSRIIWLPVIKWLLSSLEFWQFPSSINKDGGCKFSKECQPHHAANSIYGIELLA